MKKIPASLVLPTIALCLLSRVCLAQPDDGDRSLTIGRYLELGVPSPDSVWGAAEYLRLIQAPIPDGCMPRLGSGRSGALFERMIAVDNLLPKGGVRKVVGGGSAVVEVHLRRLDEYTRHIPTMMLFYISEEPGPQKYGAEITRISLFMVKSYRASFDLASALFDPRLVSRQNSPQALAARRMCEGLNITIIGVIGIFDDESHFRAADLEYLAGGLRRELPLLVGYLSSNERKSLHSRIRGIVEGTSNPRIRKSMSGLLPKLR
jgi:hypothetical protein